MAISRTPFCTNIVRTCFPSLFILPVVAAAALTWAPGTFPGGDGEWDATSTNWLQDGNAVVFTEGWDLRFPAPGGEVTVDGDFSLSTMTLESGDYFFLMDNFAGSRLEMEAIAGKSMIGFYGLIGAGANAYPALETIRSTGLNIAPAGLQKLEVDLRSLEGGSPVLGVTGGQGALEFAGKWISDNGSIYSWARLEEGGHLILGPEADMRFIKEGFFTLQLWVTGDGTGTLELHPDFVADRTEGGSIRLGIGSIRMGGGTLISHHAQNLPLGYRPRSDGSAQTNGHLVFENRPGSRWIVRGEDQVYPGAVWIHQSMEIVTESNLVHAGVSESSSNYLARNGWSVLEPATVRKTGPGSLTLAGEQSYAPGSTLIVGEGTLVMQSDPAAGFSLYDQVTGAQLTLQIDPDGAVEWSTDGSIQSLFQYGELLLDGTLEVQSDGAALFSEHSRTRLHLATGNPAPLIRSEGPVFVAGELVVSRDPSFRPPAGSEWILCEAGDLANGWVLDDRTGLGLQFATNGNTLSLVTTREAPDLPGEVILEDHFDSPAAHWKDLSLVPRWGSPLANGTAFEWINGVVRLQRSGERSTLSYVDYRRSDGLKTFTNLDHRFSSPILHASSEVTIDFRLRWPVTGSSSGEEGRVIFALNHDYPEGGLDLAPEGTAGSRIDDFSAEWWARPAYHLRLRNGTTAAGSSFLQYGGGKTELGEYEATDSWWLPGFISGADSVAPGNGDDFPANSWVRTREGMARDTFTRFRYRVLPDRQELWRDDNDDGALADDELKAVMPLPQTSEAPYYSYFPELEGLRIYWNGSGSSGQMELDWVRIYLQENVSPIAEAGDPFFAQVLVDDRALVRLDASASIDPESDPLLYTWFLANQHLLTTNNPVAHLKLPEGEHLLELLVLDAAGNHALDTVQVTVTVGQARPVAEAGPDQTVPAENGWFGVAVLSGANSFSPQGTLVRYEWTTGNPARILYAGELTSVPVALPIGSNPVTLTVWDAEGNRAEDTVRVIVESPASGEPATTIYRENFSRRDLSYGEMGVAEVGWKLTQYTGDPVAEVIYDGNAHRCLGWDSYGNAPYFPRINANPTGTEFDAQDAAGHLWMNQMPFQNTSPAEWLLWTDEFTINQSQWELAEITFYGQDSSPELVEVAPAVRIDGQWYIGWDLRVEKANTSYWKYYRLLLDGTGWYLFEPSLFFTIRGATPVSRLPGGEIEAFGFWFFKEYAWYINKIDNFALNVRPRAAENAYGPWLTKWFPQEILTDASQSLSLQPGSDPDGDGWANIWEYAQDGDPLLANSPGTTALHWQEGQIQLDVPVNEAAINLSFSAYSSEDLQSWTPLEVVPEPYTDPESGQPRQRLVVEPGINPAGNRFFILHPAFVE